MPGRNGAGPMGFGPMTGWGRGYCRRGTYPRRFRYNCFRDYSSPYEEKEFLQDQINHLKARLEEIDEMLESFKDE